MFTRHLIPSVEFFMYNTWTFPLNRQSYDVEIELTVDGTGIKSKNTLDLKNPYFRYTGTQTPTPAGTNTVSPTELYWNMATSSTSAVNENGNLDGSCGNMMTNGLVVNDPAAYAGGKDDIFACCWSCQIIIIVYD